MCYNISTDSCKLLPVKKLILSDSIKTANLEVILNVLVLLFSDVGLFM